MNLFLLSRIIFLTGNSVLTSILMAALEYFPNVKYFRKEVVTDFADPNDREEDEGENESAMQWQFQMVLPESKKYNFEELNVIKSNVAFDNHYDKLTNVIRIDDAFLSNHYLGFSYIVRGLRI